jgi:imidazolonepropionase-like amidohydrolase
MKNNLKFILIILVFVLLLPACQPSRPTEVITQQSPEQDEITENEMMSSVDYLEGAEVIAFDELSRDSQDLFFGENYTASEGVFQMVPDGANFAYLGSSHPFRQGEAALALVKFSKDTHFESAFDLGNWATAGYKRWGMYKLDELSSNVMFGSVSQDPAESFSGSLQMTADRWYFLLFILKEDHGIQLIWEKDAPENVATHTIFFEPDWQNQTWELFFQVFEGMLEIDEFTVLKGSFNNLPDSVVTERASYPAEEQTSEESVPEETADVILFNGKVLTMTDGLPVVDAIGIKGGIILAVGSNEQIQELANEETVQVDLDGHTLMPGFIDPHTHIFDSGTSIMGMSVEETQQLALENGITSMGGFVNEDELNNLLGMDTNQNLRMRTNVYLYATGACGELFGEWYFNYPPTRNFGEMLRINGVKIFTDGGTCGYPAVTKETHPEAGMGDLWFDDQQLLDLVAYAHSNGYQVAIHALGDRAIRQAQDTIISVNGGSDNLLRHRIEHNYYMSDDLIPRFQENGIMPVIFGQFPTCAVIDINRTEYWKQTIARWRDLLVANGDLPIAAKTDTPYVGEENIILSLYSLTTMKEIAKDGSVCQPPDWLKQRAITVEEALPMITINAAYALFRETEVGTLETGKLADLIILSENPLEIPEDDLLNLEVWLTMVGGKVEFCAEGREIFCP